MEAMKAVAKTPIPLLIPWRQTEIQFTIKCSCFRSELHNAINNWKAAF